MTARILYFTKGAIVDEAEKADIATLNGLAEQPYDVIVLNGSVSPNLGNINPTQNPILVEADYAAGTIPDEYSGLPVFDPDNHPGGGGDLPDTQAIISDGDEVSIDSGTGSVSGAAVVNGNELIQVDMPDTAYLAVSGSVNLLPASGTTPAQGSVTRTVAGGVESIRLPATSVVIANGASLAIQNSAGASIGSGSATVAANAVSNVRLPATIAGLANSGTVQVLGATGSTSLSAATAAVASGALTGVRLPSTAGIVTNGQTIDVTGGTVTITVVNNAVTATFEAS